MNTHLDINLKQLRLPGIRENLALRLQEAQTAQLGHEQFLEPVHPSRRSLPEFW